VPQPFSTGWKFCVIRKSSADKKIKMILGGGDSLEENFVLDSDDSASVSSEESNDKSEIRHSQVSADSGVSNGGTDDSESDRQPGAKKPKLNWREGALLNDGRLDSQSKLMTRAYEAFTRFFPADDLVTEQLNLCDINFVDCHEFTSQENKSVRDMLRFLDAHGAPFLRASSGPKKMRTLFVTGSATRAMYLVKELREIEPTIAPLPLFFHGGGRKKEQALTHESVLRGKKTSVSVCLPSRLLSVCESGLMDLNSVSLIVFDLRPNEKRLNVLSQKETLRDVFHFLLKYVARLDQSNLKFALL
jgi:hypothetical protein